MNQSSEDTFVQLSASSAREVPQVFHLYRTDLGILAWVIGIFLAVFVVEFVYVERHPFDVDAQRGVIEGQCTPSD
ncbi:hypothetical protein ACKVMT_03125 [Halobacteriales archaeon Cl-PHB]